MLAACLPELRPWDSCANAVRRVTTRAKEESIMAPWSFPEGLWPTGGPDVAAKAAWKAHLSGSLGCLGGGSGASLGLGLGCLWLRLEPPLRAPLLARLWHFYGSQRRPSRMQPEGALWVRRKVSAPFPPLDETLQGQSGGLDRLAPRFAQGLAGGLPPGSCANFR